jgi:mRNA interferase MazF
MMLIKRGDVVRVLFPNSNLVSSKRRPALVVQADDLDSGLSQILLAMITSNMSRAGHPSRVTILLNSTEGAAAGLRLDSVIMTDNIVTVLENELDSILGTISDMRAVDDALLHSFGLKN